MAKESVAPSRVARLTTIVLTMLLAVTMVPAAGLQPALADESAAAATDAASEGLLYKVVDGKATLVGFEEGAGLEGDVVVPESADGATVAAVEMAEGQVAEGVTSLTLPQTVESVKTEGLASAFPSLASVEVDGTQGVYSTSGGMLFLQGKDAASSDGSTTLARHRELVWAPPALVVARLPIECKAIAPGAFVDAYALETVMCPGVMESIAVAEKDGEGSVIAPGAFTDEQIANLSIVVPGTNIASPSGDRVSASVALSEDEGMEAKREAWWKYGFNSDKIVMGTSFGEVEGVVAVSDEGVAENPSIDILKPYEKKELAEAAESGDAEAAARLAAPEGSGLSFSYNADMNLSVSWAGDKTATPATVEIPAYVTIDGVKYAVTEVAPEAFKGAVFLASATIPEGVRVIGESAFENCSNLKEVSLPSTLRTIDYAAFKGCAALESVEIPDSVTWIGGEAFEGCGNMQSVGIEGSMSSELGQSNSTDADVSSYASFGPADGYDYEFNYDTNEYQWYSGAAYQEENDYDAMLYHSSPDGVETPVGYARYEGNDKFYGNCLSHSHWNTLPDLYVRQEKPFPDRYITDNGSSLVFGHNWAVYGNALTRVRGNVIYSIAHATAGAAGDGTFYGYAIIPPNLRFYNEHIGQILPAVFDERMDYRPGRYYVYELVDYSFEYDEATASTGGVRTQSYTIEDADYHLKDPAERPGYKFQGWTGPGYGDVTPTNALDLRTSIAALGEGETTLEFEGHWEPVSTAKFVTGTGVDPDNITYFKGDTKELPTTVNPRTGFFFAGWYPSSAGDDYWNSGYWASKQDGRTLVDRIGPEASGDVTFTAIWKPKLYTVNYDTSKSAPAGGGDPKVAPPSPKTFAHPSAADELAKHGPLTFGVDESGGTVGDLDFAGNAYFDLAGVSRAMASDYSLGEPADRLGAFPFVGWCKNPNLEIGTVPKAENGDNRYWTTLREAGTNYFTEVFLDGWSGYNDPTKPMETTVYGVWGTTGEATVNLAATQPSHVSNIGDQVVEADERGNATRGTESIRFRENLGFIGQDGVETLHTGTEQRVSAGHSIDSAMGLVAPVRYGFEFIGWGEASGEGGLEATTTDAAVTTEAAAAGSGDAGSGGGTAQQPKKIYIAYDEDVARAGEKTGFTLTAAGAALIDGNDTDKTYAYKGADTWSAYWRIRTYDLTLRVPSYAVENVDVAGDSTKGTASEDWEYTQAAYTDYAWREGGQGDTGSGGTASWYTTTRTWNYFDRIEYPKFTTREGYYSYDGWFDKTKPTSTDSTKKAQEETGAVQVATFATMRPEKWGGAGVPVAPGTRTEADGFKTDSGLDIAETVFDKRVYGDDGKLKDYVDGAKELWLWTSPIRINVASPIGVYLCTVNSKGEAVEPYVVGNDTRTQLEAPATFQVAQNSHDLQLVGVTAEDVTQFERKYEGDGDAATPVKDAKGVHLVDETTVKTEADDGTDKGLADKILNPKYTSSIDNYTYDDEGSRMFWVSPVPSATDDQTGVIYDGNAVGKRRYFGFGYTQGGSGAGSGSGVGTDPAPSDNVIYDDLDNTSASTTDYKLKDFVLRKYESGKPTSADGGSAPANRNELEYLGLVNGSDTYRFYYGLDLRRAEFDLTGLKDVIQNSSEVDYNSAFDLPLLRVKFTFAAARNTGISYYSARLADDAVMMPGDTGTDGIAADTQITVGM